MGGQPEFAIRVRGTAIPAGAKFRTRKHEVKLRGAQGDDAVDAPAVLEPVDVPLGVELELARKTPGTPG
eukprot:9021547-Alexandrium_andersonii.AAC.1